MLLDAVLRRDAVNWSVLPCENCAAMRKRSPDREGGRSTMHAPQQSRQFVLKSPRFCPLSCAFRTWLSNPDKRWRSSYNFGDASVAQLDRASVFGTEGWGFESLRAYCKNFGKTSFSRYSHSKIQILASSIPPTNPPINSEILLSPWQNCCAFACAFTHRRSQEAIHQAKTWETDDRWRIFCAA